MTQATAITESPLSILYSLRSAPEVEHVCFRQMGCSELLSASSRQLMLSESVLGSLAYLAFNSPYSLYVPGKGLVK